MAYRKSSGTRRSVPRRSGGGYRSGGRAAPRGRSRSKRSSGARSSGRGQQTLKIVIETMGSSPVARPEGALQSEKKGTKSRF